MERLTEREPYWLGEEFWTRAREPDEEEIDAVYEKLKKYEDMEESLKKVYGECDGLLETAVKHICKIEENQKVEVGNPFKSRLLTDEDADKWERWKNAEEDGKLMILPCKPGDTVYSYCSELDAILPYFVEQVVVDYDEENWVNFTMVANFNELDELIDCIDFEEKAIRKTVFLTEQEAKEALEGMENE